MADSCSRALYFAYFPWDDDDQDLARFIRKQVTTPDLLAGTIVDTWIKFGLLQLKESGSYPKNLAKDGVKEFDRRAEYSLNVANIAKRGKKPPEKELVFLHHLYGSDGLFAHERAKETIIRSLDFFETSCFLDVIRQVDPNDWKTVLTNTEDVPYFTATAELGFSTSIGHRVYAAYDFAFEKDGVLCIQEWKTGKRSVGRERAAEKQLAVYTLWGMSLGYPLEYIHVQRCWFEPGETWHPTALSPSAMREAIDIIEAEDLKERGLLAPICDKHGEVIKYQADRDDFPPQPELQKCTWCHFRAICKEGKQLVRENRKSTAAA